METVVTDEVPNCLRPGLFVLRSPSLLPLEPSPRPTPPFCCVAMEEAREDNALTAGDEAPSSTTDRTSSPPRPDVSLDGSSRGGDDGDTTGSPRPFDARLPLRLFAAPAPTTRERRSTQEGLEGDTTFVGEPDLDAGDTGDTDLGGLPLPLILAPAPRPAGEVVDVATLPLDSRRLFSSLTASCS